MRHHIINLIWLSLVSNLVKSSKYLFGLLWFGQLDWLVDDWEVSSMTLVYMFIRLYFYIYMFFFCMQFRFQFICCLVYYMSSTFIALLNLLHISVIFSHYITYTVVDNITFVGSQYVNLCILKYSHRYFVKLTVVFGSWISVVLKYHVRNLKSSSS